MSLEAFDFNLGLISTGNKPKLASTAPAASAAGSASGTPQPQQQQQRSNPLPLEDATAKEKAWMKVDQGVNAAQMQLLQGKKLPASTAALPKSKNMQAACSALAESAQAMEATLAKMTALSVHRAFREGEAEPELEELQDFLKKAQDTLNGLAEAISMVKALYKKK